MGVGRNLLINMALARAARSQFDQIIVTLDERDHAQKDHPFRPLAQRLRLQADRTDEQIFPFFGQKGAPRAEKQIQHIRFAQLDGAQRIDSKRPAILFLGDGGIIGERDFRVKTVGEHALVFVHQTVADAHIAQGQTGQLGHIAVGFRIEAGAHDIDQLHRSFFPRPGLKQSLLSGAHSTILELALDDLQSLFDFVFIHCGAIASQEELDHVGRHRVLAAVFAHQILAHQIAVKGGCGFLIQYIEFHATLFLQP